MSETEQKGAQTGAATDIRQLAVLIVEPASRKSDPEPAKDSKVSG